MDLNNNAPITQRHPPSSHYHKNIVSNILPPININKNVAPSTAEGIATTERVPTSTWGPFTMVVVVFLVILTCFILNCSRIRRRVSERKMDKLGRSGPFKKRSFERRHKELQEADLEWNNHPPMVYEDKMLATPESIHCSKYSSISSSGWSSKSTLAAAQSHHYNDINFIKNQPPGVQLRLTLENAFSSSIAIDPNSTLFANNASNASNASTRTSKSSTSIQRPMILPHHQPNTAIDSNEHNLSSSTAVTISSTKYLPSLPSPAIHHDNKNNPSSSSTATNTNKATAAAQNHDHNN